MQQTMPRDAALLAAADADLDALGDRLHDGPLQALAGARYACDAVTRGADPAVARDAVQHALVLLRRELWLLRPRGEDGLAAALTELSDQLVAAGRPGLRLRVDPTVRLLPRGAVTAYRLVQAVAGRDPLDVALSGDGILRVDRPVAEPDTWALRAAAVGAELHVTATSTLLVLPIAKDAP